MIIENETFSIYDFHVVEIMQVKKLHSDGHISYNFYREPGNKELQPKRLYQIMVPVKDPEIDEYTYFMSPINETMVKSKYNESLEEGEYTVNRTVPLKKYLRYSNIEEKYEVSMPELIQYEYELQIKPDRAYNIFNEERKENGHTL